ncbi:hypothetical protein OXX79_005207 [Metschnikowia pulcherrima]
MIGPCLPNLRLIRLVNVSLSPLGLPSSQKLSSLYIMYPTIWKTTLKARKMKAKSEVSSNASKCRIFCMSAR